MLTLFRPATGALRAQGVERTPNVVLHAWLKDAVEAILDPLPPPAPPTRPEQDWAFWLGHPPATPLPPLRLILVWDNLAGHYTPEIVVWLFAHGILPLYTPLSGSWLNMAESVQRIVVRRALAGTHPQNAQEVIEWLNATIAGWNRRPTPFVWKGKRYARRQRARLRRLGGSGAAVADCNLIAA
jgi:hypothetical protein